MNAQQNNFLDTIAGSGVEGTMSRRRMLLLSAGAAALPFLAGCRSPDRGNTPRRTSMGVVTYSFNIHQKNKWAGRYPGLSPGLAFLEECHRIGAGGVQFPFGAEDAPVLADIRSRAERLGMRVEASIEMPSSNNQLDLFEQKVKWAGEAGARVARTVVLPGRRYEQFKTLDEFRKFEALALANLRMVEPIVARHKLRLAVENHKDQLVPEKRQMLTRLGSEYVGICLDVGNNIALGEEAMAVVHGLAPYTFTVHLKDHIASPYPEGYLLWDAALGQGFLPLAEMVQVIRQARPEATFNLEVITRDPLKVPVYTDAHWATLPDQRKPALEWIPRMLKDSPPPRQPLTLASGSLEQQLALETYHCEASIRFARESLRI